jgi:hypothetical protein
MKKLLLLMLLAVAASAPLRAQDAKPSEASVKQLFQAMHVGKLLDSYYSQLDGMLDTSMRQALQGQELNPQQQKIFADMRAKMTALIKQDLNWQGMEPMFVEAYRNTYTQSEVDGISRFYRSPAGEAMTAKQPALMQQVMQAMQQKVADLTPRLVELQKDTIRQLQAAKAAPPPGAGEPVQKPN